MAAFSKFPFPEKIFLSGPDCFHLLLDKHATKNKSGDNVMRIVFYFDHPVDSGKVETVVNRSPIVHWLCNIKLNPGLFFGKPFWKYANEGRGVTVTLHQYENEFELPPLLLNRNIPIDAQRFIECDIVYYPGGKSALVFSWNHILMDGRGIGMFVNHLDDPEKLISNDLKKIFPIPEKSTSPFRYIRNMYEVKRFIRTSSRSPIASVYQEQKNSSPHFHNRIIYFTRHETAMIEKNAFSNGARFGANLFYLACSAHAVKCVNRERNNDGDIWIPIPYDGRLKGSAGPVISNFVAYLFYRLGAKELLNIGHTVQSMNKQMAAQLKDEMPRKYNMLLKMMRHIPLGLYYFLVNQTGKGSFASFLYSSTGNNFNSLHTLFGDPVKNLTIYPSSTFPPGLTFSFLKHGDALNVNIAYSSDILSNIEVDFIETNVRNLLLGRD